MDEKDKKELENDLLNFSRAKYKSAQEKFNALQALAKKYNMPVEKLLKNIIMEWVYEGRQKKFEKKD